MSLNETNRENFPVENGRQQKRSNRSIAQEYQFLSYLSAKEKRSKQKGKALVEELKKLGPGLWLLVVHPGTNTPEARALIDANPDGLKDVAFHRAAVTNALTSKKVKKIVEKRNIRLTDYRKLEAKK